MTQQSEEKMASWLEQAQRIKIDVTYQVKLSGSMAIGSGFRRGMLQKALLRDQKGFPLLPASMVKGRTRDVAERLVKLLQIDSCQHSPLPDRMCGATKTPEEAPCLVCRTFGSPGRSSLSVETGLIWRDPEIALADEQMLLDAGETDFFEERAHVQLSRKRGVAMEKRLFNQETSVDGLRFDGRVRGWLTCIRSKSSYPEEVMLLLASLKLLNFVGGSKSSGLGFCEVQIARLDIDNQASIDLDQFWVASESWLKPQKGLAS